jgi:hypothetical protein
MSEAMYPTHPILIIDVEAICWLLVNAILRQFGLNNIITCQDSRKALDLISQQPFALNITRPY